MEKTTLFIVRHGVSEANLQERFGFCLDARLTPLGEEQARRVSAALEMRGVDTIVASTIPRAAATLQPLADALGLAIEPCAGLREIESGEWDGQKVADIRDRWPELYEKWCLATLTEPIPGGECIAQLAARVMDSLRRLTETHAGGRIAVATHAVPVRLVGCLLGGKALEELNTVPWADNASITTVEMVDGEWHLVRYGESDHLGDLRVVAPEETNQRK